jgi:GDPmannose 4,6-dehydratase
MKALLLGITGQDGSAMAEFLYNKGYEVYGIVRSNTNGQKVKWLKSLVHNVNLLPYDVSNRNHLALAIESTNPDEIYNFCGISNVFRPFDNLEDVFKINALLPQHILDIIQLSGKPIKFFNAGSCLVYGNDKSGVQSEYTAFNPIYPYGAAKLYAQNLVSMFRESGVFACTGILFPHESERRGEDFFTKKVCRQVVEIKKGLRKKLELGDLTALRDWTYAPDICEAAWLMLQEPKANDFVIGSGKLTSLLDFVKMCFEHVNLNYNDYIGEQINVRVKDTNILKADITRASSILGWTPTHSVLGIVTKMMADALKI